MKVVLLIDNLGSGGAQRQMLTLALGIAEKCQVTLLTYQENSHMENMILDDSFKRVRVGNASKMSRVIGVFKSLLHEKPDVIISFLDTPNKIAGLYKIFSRNVTWIPSERNVAQSVHWTETLWRRVLYKNAHVVVSNTIAQRDWLSNVAFINKHKLITIYNGISPHLFDEGVRTGKSFVSFGRLSYQKNPELLLDALVLIKDSIPIGTDFSWYGEEDPGCSGLRDILNEKAKSLSLPISFYKPVKNVTHVMEKSRYFVMTSRFEGTPNALIEAMANKLYPVCTRIADVPEFIDNKKCYGHLYDSENAQGLAESILAVLAIPEVELNSITATTAVNVRNLFSERRMVDEFWELVNGQ